MIKAVFCDTGALLQGAGEKFAELSPRLFSLRERTGEARRLERLGAYILLSHLIDAEGIDENVSVLFDALGKPYLSGSDAFISLSHRPGCALCVISDSAIGCDLEKNDNPDRIKRVEEKFLSGIDFSGLKPLDFELYFARLSEDGKLATLEKVTKKDNNTLHFKKISPDSTPYSRWNVLEAALKCEGGGFASLSRADALIRRYRIGCAELVYNGCLYSLAVVKA